MNRILGLELTSYSLLLIGLSWLAYYLAPAIARPTLIVGCVAGVLCLIWALRALQGRRGKGASLLTLGPTTFVLLSQAVLAWSGRNPGSGGRTVAAAVITVLAVLSFAMLLRIAYAGAFAAEEAPSVPAQPGQGSHPAKHEQASKHAGHGA